MRKSEVGGSLQWSVFSGFIRQSAFRNPHLPEFGLGLVAELLGGEALDGVVIHGAFLRQGEGFGVGEAEFGGMGSVFHGGEFEQRRGEGREGQGTGTAVA